MASTIHFPSAIVIGVAIVLGSHAAAQTPPAFFDGVDDDPSRRAMQKARERIESHRKGDFALTLVDEAGKPVSGNATVELAEHEFLFGGAMTYALELEKHPLMSRAYRSAQEVARELFNIVTINCHWNDLQPTINGPHDWAETDRMIAWAKSNGFKIRGHALVYLRTPIPAPPWLNQVKSADQWWQLVDAHFEAVAERYGDDYLEIDVMNEPRYHTKFREQFSWLPKLDDPETARRYFEVAKKHFKNTRLMPLDQWTLTGNEGNPEREKATAIMRAMIDAGAQVDAVGTQGHFFPGWEATDIRQGNPQGGPDAFHMKEIDKGLDSLAEFGLPVHITEFQPPARNRKTLPRYPNQPRLSDEEIAAWSANFYTLAFSKPHINGVSTWFIVDGVGGNMLDAGLVRVDGTKKPLYHALRKLIKEDWHTRWTAPVTQPAKFRGFHGTYEIRVPGYEPVKVELLQDSPKEQTVKMIRLK